MFGSIRRSAAVLGFALALLAASLLFIPSKGSAAPDMTDRGEAAGFGTPDLVVQSVTFPNKAFAGQLVDVRISVRNLGGPTDNDGFIVDFYKDRGSAPGAFEVGDSVFRCALRSIDAFQTIACVTFAEYPAPGSYDVWAQVDTDDKVSESNEANNVFGPVKLIVNQEQTPTPTATPNCPGCSMSLEVEGTLGGSAVACDSKTGTVQNPAKCTLEEGSSFVVKIVANTIPPAEYVGWQTFLAYGGLGYQPAADAADEVVWPDTFVPLRSGLDCSAPCGPPVGDEGRVIHGALSGSEPPLPVSSHVGPLVELQMNCQTASDRLALLPYQAFPLGPLGAGTLGATYVIAGIPTTSLSTEGFLQLDIDNDGQLDRKQILKPTPTEPPFQFPQPPTATPAFNDGELISYAVHTLIDVNCVEAPPAPVGGIGLEVDFDALPLDASHSSTGHWLQPTAALGTMAFAGVVLTGAAWVARRRIASNLSLM